MTTPKPATPVKLHHVPKWLRQRIHQRIGRGVDLHEAIQRTASDIAGGYWLDHYGSTCNALEFVSEPYTLDTAGLQGVLRFAFALGLNVRIQAASEWNPSGGTFRVTFTPDSASN